MFASSESGYDASAGRLPLTIPQEIWSRLPAAHQAHCRVAERILDAFDDERELTAHAIAFRVNASSAEIVAGLQVLESMSLVDVEPTDNGAAVTLLALPDEHVRFVGLNGRVQWLFVARPLDAPEVDAATLN